MTDDWLKVMETAHSIGMESTATMVLGLGETIEERIEHMRRVRDLKIKQVVLELSSCGLSNQEILN